MEIQPSIGMHPSRIQKARQEKKEGLNDHGSILRKVVKTETFWKTIWMLICLSGFSYQTYEMTDHFFQYPVMSSVTIQMEHEFYPPALSVCFNANHVRIPNQFNKTNCKFKKKLECNIFNYFSYNEIFNRLTEKLFPLKF